MHRSMRLVSWSLCLATALAGCDLLQSLLPLIDQQSDPSPEVVDSQSAGQHGRSFIPLAGGHVLTAKPSERGLKIIDVHDPRHLHVEGSIDVPVYEGQLFRMGEHVVYRSRPVGLAYRGERDDVDLPKERGSSLVNIDISDRAHPVLINAIPVRDVQGRSVQAEGQSGSALFVAESNYDSQLGSRSQIRRYELQDELLTQTGMFELTGEVTRLEARGTRLLAVLSSYASRTLIDVIDSSAASLKVMYTAAVPGGDGRVEQLGLDGDKLRVLYRRSDEWSNSGPAVDTFDLSTDEALGNSGRCDFGLSRDYYSLDASLISERNSSVFASNAGNDAQLRQFVLDAAGNCASPRSFAADSRSYALQELSSARLLTAGPLGLQLFDSTSSGASAALASVPLTTGYFGGSAAKPIHVFSLPQPSAAPEPWLIAVFDRSSEPAGIFQLLSASDTKLTPRSTISERGVPEDIALYTNTLLTLSSTQLRTFDIRDVQAPRELGQLSLSERYYYGFEFGDYIARIRQNPWSGGSPDETAIINDLEVVPLDASDGPAIASLAVATNGNWVQAEDLLLNVRWNVVSWQDRTISLAVQAYDLSEPARPRKAGAFTSADLHAEFVGIDTHFPEVSLPYRAVGRSLVLPQREQRPNAHIHWCWKSVKYTVCAEADPSGCTPEYYQGLLRCNTTDNDPETCTLNDASHCVGTDCQQVNSLPEDSTVEELNCSDYEEPRNGPVSLLAVIDFRDADHPALVQPTFQLEGADFSGFAWGILEGKKYYHSAAGAGALALQATTIDFANPRQPIVGAPQPVPARIAAVTADDVYTATDSSDLTLSRVPWNEGAPPPAATRSWPGRSLYSLVPDNAGHLFVIHAPPFGAQPGPEPHSHWARLEVLDAQTLATLSTLDLDVHALILGSLDGRLLISLPDNGLLFVDVRDAAHPMPQAAVLFSLSDSLYTANHRVYILENGQARSYPIDLQNLVH